MSTPMKNSNHALRTRNTIVGNQLNFHTSGLVTFKRQPSSEIQYGNQTQLAQRSQQLSQLVTFKSIPRSKFERHSELGFIDPAKPSRILSQVTTNRKQTIIKVEAPIAL